MSAVALAKAELPDTLSRAPLRRHAPFPPPPRLRWTRRSAFGAKAGAWLTRCRSFADRPVSRVAVCEIRSNIPSITSGAHPQDGADKRSTGRDAVDQHQRPRRGLRTARDSQSGARRIEMIETGDRRHEPAPSAQEGRHTRGRPGRARLSQRAFDRADDRPTRAD